MSHFSTPGSRHKRKLFADMNCADDETDMEESASLSSENEDSDEEQ